MGVRVPEEMTQRQASFRIHRNALCYQQVPLDPVTTFTAEAHRNPPLSVHHAVPGNVGRELETTQRPAHLTRTAKGTDQISDQAIGRQATVGDTRHLIPDALIKGAAKDVRFNEGILGRDLDGERSADFLIVVPGTTAWKDPNLLLSPD